MPATHDYWPLVMENLKQRISPAHYKTWFSRIDFVDVDNQGRKLVLSIPSAFNRNYIESKYKTDLREAVSKYYPQVVHIDFQVSKADEVEEIQQEQDQLNLEHPSDQATQHISSIPSESSAAVSSTDTTPGYLPKKSLNNLNPRYTFDNYVIGKYNELVANVAKGVIEAPGTLYNPLFIYSNVGLGKTHLIQALGHKMLENRPQFNIKYIPAETFKQQYITAVQKNEYAKFREYYGTIDLLLMDDIQSMAGNEGTQTVFFHIFNELHQANKQIIITCDKHPKDLYGIDDRLLSRFEGGMVVDVPVPDIEDRTAIIKEKLAQARAQLSPAMITKIATNINTNVRDIEGILNQIQAYIRMRPDNSFAMADLDTLLSKRIEVNQSISDTISSSPDTIIQATARIYGINSADILGSKRSKDIAEARQLVMWMIKHNLDFSYPSIGKILGGRDHSTVMHGVQKITKKLESDTKLQEKVKLVKQAIQG